MAPADAGLTRLDDAPAPVAEDLLRACCAAPRWVERMLARRPFPDRPALLAAAADELAALDWAQVRLALDAHPRIGERVAGDGTEAAWSRSEQAGMRSATRETQAALIAANRAYEERFGHVFLIFATGRSDTEMLAAARTRLGNTDETERALVRAELARIVALRLEKAAS